MNTELDTSLLSAKQAAKRLGICGRTLWTLTNADDIRHVHITAKAVRYDPRDIEEFIARRKCGRPPARGEPS